MTLSDDFQNLRVGDIFYAEYDSVSQELGAAICLVIDSTSDTIVARTVTTQWVLRFDRRTLTAPNGSRLDGFRVRSVKPLPDDIRSVLVGLDARYRAGDDPGLSEPEQRALLFTVDHYGDVRRKSRGER